MLGERLKLLRESYHLTTTEFAKRLNVTKQTASNWENNNVLPSVEMLVKIANLYHVSSDYLLEIDDHRTVDVSDLSTEIVAHIQQIIDDIRG